MTGQQRRSAERWLAADPDPRTRAEPASLLASAERWLAADPDPRTRAELASLIRSDHETLARRFSTRLTFGTAGIRGVLGAGPARMNRVLMRIVAAALAERLYREPGPAPHVVVGRDARRLSEQLAEDASRVLEGRGVRVTALDGPMPTPVLAFAVRHLNADAGMIITASHNPRDYNGAKIYWRGGAQLCSPVDRETAAIIERAEPVPQEDLSPVAPQAAAALSDEVAQAYLAAVGGLLEAGGPRGIRIAYTPLHGVGGPLFLKAAAAAGFADVTVVDAQARPDPRFPTAASPNPEEPEALDLLLSLAEGIDATLALAHDPDADRLAAAFSHQGRWRTLTGDETGCLLAEHLLTRSRARRRSPTDVHASPALSLTGPPATGARQRQEASGGPTTVRRKLLINTVVSSSLLSKIAAAHDADYVRTLTGFKWIMRARNDRRDTHDFVLGYENALGYAVGEAVQDKDGISAALLTAELAARLAAEGRSLADLLDDLHRRHGVHVNGQRSIRFDSAEDPAAAMAQRMSALRATAPARLAGVPVTAVRDLSAESARLPRTDALILELGEHQTAMIRPSGTEPKIKVYAEVTDSPRGSDEAEKASGRGDPGHPDNAGGLDDDALPQRRAEARQRLEALLDDVVELLGASRVAGRAAERDPSQTA